MPCSAGIKFSFRCATKPYSLYQKWSFKSPKMTIKAKTPATKSLL